MRLIDADALLKSAGIFEAKACARGCGKSTLRLAKAWLSGEVHKAPTIDAVPVPCKIGDEVYGIRNYKGKAVVQKGFVGEMFFRKDMKLMIVVKFVCRGVWLENVFPTYEAAEAAMRKDGGGNG